VTASVEDNMPESFRDFCDVSHKNYSRCLGGLTVKHSTQAQRESLKRSLKSLKQDKCDVCGQVKVSRPFMLPHCKIWKIFIISCAWCVAVKLLKWMC